MKQPSTTKPLRRLDIIIDNAILNVMEVSGVEMNDALSRLMTASVEEAKQDLEALFEYVLVGSPPRFETMYPFGDTSKQGIELCTACRKDDYSCNCTRGTEASKQLERLAEVMGKS